MQAKSKIMRAQKDLRCISEYNRLLKNLPRDHIFKIAFPSKYYSIIECYSSEKRKGYLLNFRFHGN